MIGFYKFADVDVAARKKRAGFFPTNSALESVVQGSGKPLLCSYGVGIMLAGLHREQELISYGHAIPQSYCKANRDSEPCFSVEGESAFNSRTRCFRHTLITSLKTPSKTLMEAAPTSSKDAKKRLHEGSRFGKLPDSPTKK